MNWTRDELLLIMNLYCRIPFGRQHSRAPEVIEMAKALGRTPGSVAMKLNNLTSLDPDEQARGVRGLAGASRLDQQVWQEFHQDWQRMAVESEALREIILPVQTSQPIDASPAAEIQTESERTVKVRRAQSFFRRVVLSAYQAKCCVTGNLIAELLVASHILPWARHPQQRVNPRNGLCLARLHDGAFDQGLIAFDDDYRLILSKRLKDHFTNQNIRDNFAGYEGKPLKMPERFYPDKTFLAGHRESVFQPQ
jgi:predicted restriction endonuclease